MKPHPNCWIHFCFVKKYPKLKMDLRKICTCVECAGFPVFGRFGCYLDPEGKIPPKYIPSSWERDQIVRIRRQKMFLNNLEKK